MWWKKRTVRKELEEDAKEDLELEDQDADKVAGGWIKASGTENTPVAGTGTDTTWK